MKVLVIAGPNGAGKTTFSRRYLQFAGPEVPFVNGDEIAALLNPGAPDAVAQRAGRIALERMESYTAMRRDFAFETTLSGRGYVRRLIKWRGQGYRIGMVYLRLPSADHVVKRVAQRVSEGGHDIPEVPAATHAGAREGLGCRDYSTGRDPMTKDATHAPDRFPDGEPSIKNVMIALRQARNDALARAEAVRQRQAEAAREEKVSSTVEA